ncbi:hypothetical protein N9E28_02410 [Alphaproteobacteria bacterium]|nr:hypothetical protein [Alphaproteobacteria bacterium]
MTFRQTDGFTETSPAPFLHHSVTQAFGVNKELTEEREKAGVVVIEGFVKFPPVCVSRTSLSCIRIMMLSPLTFIGKITEGLQLINFC